MRRGFGLISPLSALRHGATTSVNVTAALTGFPGNANTRSGLTSPFILGIVANVHGFPGFIANLPK